MTLLPSLRHKKRYLTYKLQGNVLATDLHLAIEQALFSFLGQWGLAQASPQVVKVEDHFFILKVHHAWVQEVKAALLFIKKIKNTPVILISQTVSGILKKAEKRGGMYATAKTNDR